MMKTYIKRYAEVDADFREALQDMILAASTYVKAVISAECALHNFEGLTGEEKRERISSSDLHRQNAHNAFISAVNIVNRLAKSAGYPPVYTGGEDRRAYGDFAITIVDDMFARRS